jgi:hypothetical protein
MASLTRYEVTETIIYVLQDFDEYYQFNKDRFSYGNNLWQYAEANRRTVHNEPLMKNMLLKLNDDALVEMYRRCGELANKYYLLSRYAMEGYDSVALEPYDEASFAENYLVVEKYPPAWWKDLKDSISGLKGLLSGLSDAVFFMRSNCRNTNEMNLFDKQVKERIRPRTTAEFLAFHDSIPQGIAELTDHQWNESFEESEEARLKLETKRQEIGKLLSELRHCINRIEGGSTKIALMVGADVFFVLLFRTYPKLNPLRPLLKEFIDTSIENSLGELILMVNEQTYHKMLMGAIVEAESEYYLLKNNADKYYSRFFSEYKRRMFCGLLKLPK